MMKSILCILVFLISGCGTFGIKDVRKSAASLEYAKQVFSKYNYKVLLQKMNPQQADVKTIDPVRLYSSVNQPMSVTQSGWNYVQSLKLVDGTECFSYLLVEGSESNFRHSPGNLYCFKSDDSFVKLVL